VIGNTEWLLGSENQENVLKEKDIWGLEAKKRTGCFCKSMHILFDSMVLHQ